MSDNGYVYAYRSAWTHPAFNNLLEAAVWNFLYQNAFWEDGERNFNGQVYLLKRGQIIISMRFLAKGFCMSEKGARMVIQKLEKLKMVATKGMSKGTIITICNYEIYQASKKTEGEQKGEHRASTGRAADANNKKESKEVINNIDDFEEFWKLYGKVGSRKRAEILYQKITKGGVAHETIIRGVGRYEIYTRANAAWYKKQNATTWLSGAEWETEWNPRKTQAKPQEVDNREVLHLGAE